MIRAIVRPDGSILLGPDAQRLGFVSGAVVAISRTSAGSLLVVLDDTHPLDVPFRPLVGGAAQLALRRRQNVNNAL